MKRKEVMRKSFDELRLEALKCCTFRGHTMRRFTTVKSQDGRIHRTSECNKCGAYVGICRNPAVSSMLITGGAFTSSCLGSREAELRERHHKEYVSICSGCGRIRETAQGQFITDEDPPLCWQCSKLTVAELARERQNAKRRWK